MRVGILALFFGVSAFASIEVGVGLNSTMSGRHIPGASLAYIDSTFGLSATSIGVQTTAYYMSTYTLSAYRMWDFGDLWWGKVTGGVGGGVAYFQRGYKATATELQKKDELVLGPAFRMTWEVLGPFVFSMEAMYGLSAGVVPHDIVTFSFGCRF